MAANAPTVHRWKTRDLDQLPDVPELRYEIIDGELIVSEWPDLCHQHIIVVLIAHLLPTVHALGGLMYPSPGIVWDELAEDNVVPDVAIVLPDRIELTRGRHLSGAPNIAVEIVSETNAHVDYTKKRHLYQRTGVQEYWIVDPFERHVEVVRFADGKAISEIFPEGSVISSTLLPEVGLPVASLFS